MKRIGSGAWTGGTGVGSSSIGLAPSSTSTSVASISNAVVTVSTSIPVTGNSGLSPSSQMAGVAECFRTERRLVRFGNTGIEQYDYLNSMIGEGTYGVVYKGSKRGDSSGRQFAIKKFKGVSLSDGLTMSACREIALLRELSHENVVRAEAVFVNPTTRDVFLVMDYAEHDLLQIITYHRELTGRKGLKKPVLIPDSMILSLVWQILNGIHYLHSNWVLHRDLKPANILVMGRGPEEGIVKIADLGMARIFQSPLKPLADVDPVVVTIWYRSPELLLGAKHYTKAVDLWSIGCIFAELITLRPIFHGSQIEDKSNKNPFQRDQLTKIFATVGVPTEKEWSNLAALAHHDKLAFFEQPAERPSLQVLFRRWFADHGLPGLQGSWLKLLEGLLTLNPSKRLTAEQALVHPCFNQQGTGPRPMSNCFQRNSPDVRYPLRKALSAKKKNASSSASSHQQQAKRQKPDTTTNAAPAHRGGGSKQHWARTMYLRRE